MGTLLYFTFICPHWQLAQDLLFKLKNTNSLQLSMNSDTEVNTVEII